MVDIVVICVIRREHLEWIKWKTVSAMVVDGFTRAESEQEHGLSDRQSCEVFCYGCTTSIQYETFQRVVVQCAESVRHVKPVMYRVQLLVQKLVGVHQTVQEVLPRVNDEEGK